MKEFLTKKYGGLPGWAWLLIGAAGIGAGIFLIRWQGSKKTSTPADLTAQSSPDLTTGNASGTEAQSETGAVGDNGLINNPFPETNVNGSQVPIIPPGYQAIYDENGNIVGYEPITSTSTTGSQTPATNTYMIRASGKFPGYDKNNSGVPFRLSPGGGTIGLIPFNSTITGSGSAVTGPNDNGSTVWFPVTYGGQNGYVSAVDILLAPTNGGGILRPLAAARRS